MMGFEQVMGRRTRRVQPLLAGLIAIVLLATSLPGHASAGVEGVTALPAGAAKALGKANAMVDHADQLRAAASAGTLSGALAAAGAVGDTTFVAHPRAVTSAPVVTTNAEFIAATRRLAREIDSASRALEPVTRRDVRRLAHARVGSVVSANGKTSFGQSEGAARPKADPALNAVAAEVAAKVDDYIASVSSFALAASEDGASGPGCDIRDQRPLLCISSDGDNTHSGTDAVLTVDLGGNDTYLNGAGGAPFVIPGQRDMAPVSVNIDLGGNDSYTAEGKSPGHAKVLVAQGAGYMGIGMLVDQLGNDTYSAHQPVTVTSSDGTLFSSTGDMWVQGTSYVGVGVLLDLTGKDRYLVARDDGALGSGWIAGQAVTNFGLATLVDISGADEYTIAGGSSVDEGCREIWGQSFAAVGSSLLADIGSEPNSFSITGGASSTTPLPPRPGGTVMYGCPSDDPGAVVTGQGYGVLQGYAALIAGTGNDEYVLDSAVSGSSIFSWAHGQGAGTSAGSGMLHDAGGSDSYSARATKVDNRTICGCGKKVLSEEYLYTVGANVAVQGASILANGWLLDVGLGADSYLAEGLADVDLTVDDSTSPAPSGAALHLIGYPRAEALAQGSAPSGNLNPQLGLLLDDGGSDSYRAAVGTTVKAAVQAGNGATRTVSATAYNANGGEVSFQGSSGYLLDLGGAKDVFRAERGVEAIGPDPYSGFAWDLSPSEFQGSGDSALVALGDKPEISSAPAATRCAPAEPLNIGWVGGTCTAPEQGTVVRPYGMPQTPSAITLEDPGTSAGDSWIPVAGKVGAVGLPAGLPVHVVLVVSAPFQRVTGVEAGGSDAVYADLWRVDALTGSDGAFNVLLPTRLDFPLDGDLHGRGYKYQIRAVFDGVRVGDKDIAPAETWTLPFTITGG